MFSAYYPPADERKRSRIIIINDSMPSAISLSSYWHGDGHILRAYHRDKDDDEQYICDMCDRYGRGDSYRCNSEACHFDAHPKCCLDLIDTMIITGPTINQSSNSSPPSKRFTRSSITVSSSPMDVTATVSKGKKRSAPDDSYSDEEGEEEGEEEEDEKSRPLNGAVKNIRFLFERVGQEATMEPLFEIIYQNNTKEKRFACEVEVIPVAFSPFSYSHSQSLYIISIRILFVVGMGCSYIFSSLSYCSC